MKTKHCRAFKCRGRWVAPAGTASGPVSLAGSGEVAHEPGHRAAEQVFHGQLPPGMRRCGQAKSTLCGAEHPCPIGLEEGSDNHNVNEENQCRRSCGLAAESLGIFRKQSVLSWECWDRLQPAQGTGILLPRMSPWRWSCPSQPLGLCWDSLQGSHQTQPNPPPLFQRPPKEQQPVTLGSSW